MVRVSSISQTKGSGRATGNEIVLVGNGPSVLQQQLGTQIDRFEIVVRFNRFVTRGFRDHVGSRTDYWFTVSNRSKRGKRRIGFQRTYWWKTKGFRRFQSSYPEAILIDPEILDEIAEVAAVPLDKYRRWSTGAIAAAVLLREFPVIHIVGFDWWDDIGKSRHHYADEHEQGVTHKPGYEQTFFRSLVKAGKVIDLNIKSRLGGSV